MWLIPVTGEGNRVVVEQHLGERLVTEDVLRATTPGIERFEMKTPAGSLDLLSSLQLLRRLEVPAVAGASLIVVERRPSAVDLDRGTFLSYLESEGHEVVARQAKDTGKKEFSERFSRHLKLIRDDGSGEASHLLQPVGLRLEIVPGESPSRVQEGEKIPLKVLFDGLPLDDVEITHYYEDIGGEIVERKATTSDGGRVTIDAVDSEAVQLIRATHLRSCQCSDFDFESFWTALSFLRR